MKLSRRKVHATQPIVKGCGAQQQFNATPAPGAAHFRTRDVAQQEMDLQAPQIAVMRRGPGHIREGLGGTKALHQHSGYDDGMGGSAMRRSPAVRFK